MDALRDQAQTPEWQDSIECRVTTTDDSSADGTHSHNTGDSSANGSHSHNTVGSDGVDNRTDTADNRLPPPGRHCGPGQEAERWAAR